MIGGNDISRYLINFNSSEWANKANAHLQTALDKGLQYSEKYNTLAKGAVEGYDQKAQEQMKQGFYQHQALNAPQHIATYNALDTYLNNLGQPTVVGGGYALAQQQYNAANGTGGVLQGTASQGASPQGTGGLLSPQTGTAPQTWNIPPRGGPAPYIPPTRGGPPLSPQVSQIPLRGQN